MPHRSPLQHQQKVQTRPSPAPRLQRPAPRAAADYTLVHAGRQLRVGPIAFWAVIGMLATMTVWTVTTATYFAFREDVLTRLIARQADMQFGYEDRIAELRAQVDRMSSRQLLDQEQYEQKLDQIMRRQVTLESHASALNGLTDPATTGSITTFAHPYSAPVVDRGQVYRFTLNHQLVIEDGERDQVFRISMHEVGRR